MPPTLENPFTPKSAIPTKRLFGGDEEIKKRKLGAKALERIKDIKEQETKVKYGNFEILKSQVDFLNDIEQEYIKTLKGKKKFSAILDIYEEMFESIEEVDEEGNIISLDFQGFWLKKLPESVGSLKKIEKLELGDNALTQLPKELFKLKNLKILGLFNNKLKSLPEEIGNLENLEGINLNWNHDFSKFPESMKKLKNLKALVCERCHIDKEEQAKITNIFPFAKFEI